MKVTKFDRTMANSGEASGHPYNYYIQVTWTVASSRIDAQAAATGYHILVVDENGNPVPYEDIHARKAALQFVMNDVCSQRRHLRIPTDQEVTDYTRPCRVSYVVQMSPEPKRDAEVTISNAIAEQIGLAIEDGKTEEEQREMWGDEVVDWINSTLGETRKPHPHVVSCDGPHG